MATKQIKKQKKINLLDIFWTFFKVGMFTLGGGLAMSAVMRHELVIKKQWLEDDDFCSLLALSTVVPGAIAVNISYLLGRQMRGWKGMIFAVLGVVLPSFIIILLIVGLLLPYFYNPKVVNFLRGCAIGVVGQLAFAGLVFSKRLLQKWAHLLICAIGVIIIGVFGLHPIFGLLTVSLIGYWFCTDGKS